MCHYFQDEKMTSGSESSKSSLRKNKLESDDVSGDVSEDTSSSGPPKYDDVMVHNNDAFELECEITRL